jgi:starch synthase
MSKLRILYISSEIDPFLETSKIASLLRKLPQEMQERGMEIRILIPRFGLINERKHRLHEVVRLSGINISIGEEEKPLIIKVASIPAAKLQVYFLDNEDYFHRKTVFTDKTGAFYDDNDERSIFFCKGALETVKKLGWAPDVVHCTDWMTSLIPLYLKTTYKNDPIFKNTKTIFTVYNNSFDHTFSDDMFPKVKMMDISDENLANLRSRDFYGFIKIGCQYSDVVVKANPSLNEEISLALDETAERQIHSYVDDENAAEIFYNLYTELAD